MDTPETVCSTECAEGSCSAEAMRNFIEGRDFIMPSNYGFVEISGVKAFVKGAMRLPGIGQGRYPLSWVTGVITLRAIMFSGVFSIWLQ